MSHTKNVIFVTILYKTLVAPMILHVSVLTRSVFGVTVKASRHLPSWFVQKIQRIVDFRERRREGTQASDAADDRHVLVDQRCHPLAG